MLADAGCSANTTWRVVMPPGPRLGGVQLGRQLRTDYFDFLKAWLAHLTFACARNPGHIAHFSLRVTQVGGLDHTTANVVGVRLTKFGQLPSLADLAASEVDSYGAFVDAADLRELKRATGLAAHGVGIGSFVYLRRIFERLVAEAADRAAAADAKFDRKAFMTLRMEDKLEAVEGHVPDWMAQNRKLYSILSLGLHELSEEACKTAFPAVKQAILALLEQHAELARKQKRAKEAAVELAKLGESLALKK
jgi:hypothetical protein